MIAVIRSALFLAWFALVSVVLNVGCLPLLAAPRQGVVHDLADEPGERLAGIPQDGPDGRVVLVLAQPALCVHLEHRDRKSTRLNSSHT